MTELGDDRAGDAERWTAALDALERRVAEQEAILQQGERGQPVDPDRLLELVNQPLPRDLPRLPVEFGGRAQELLDRTHLIQDGVANLLATTRPARSVRRVAAPRRGAHPSRDLDVRA